MNLLMTTLGIGVSVFICLILYVGMSSGLSGAIGALIPFWFLVMMPIARWLILRKEAKHLPQENISQETTFFHDNFMSRVRAGLHDSLPSHEISQYLNVLNSDDKIILLQSDKAFPNILRCRLDGSIRWQAELPTGPSDAYTNMEWNGQNLLASSRSHQSVLLDPNTGRVLSAESSVRQNGA